MKTIALEKEKRTLAEFLADADEDVVFLTRKGRARFAVIPLDEGDEEVLAIRMNSALMAYLDKAEARAQRGPRKSLQELKRKYNLDRKVSNGKK